jgi:hypothetical protein
MVTIYSLSDPDTRQIRYVGKTTSSLSVRYAHHLFQWKREKKRHINTWIKSLHDKKKKPIIEILDEVSDMDWSFWEMFWIEQVKAWGFRLCNHTKGGEGSVGYKFSCESIQKRLNTLKDSVSWFDKHIRHSAIMKEKHKEGLIHFGYSHLSKEKRTVIGNNHSLTMKRKHQENPELVLKLNQARKKKVNLISKEQEILETFGSVTEAGKYCNIDPTHVSRVCKGKSKHAYGLFFKYAE